MKILVEIEYEPDKNESFERTEEIVIGNIQNCLGKVISVKKESDTKNGSSILVRSSMPKSRKY